jgi:serine/threonine protein kinase
MKSPRQRINEKLELAAKSDDAAIDDATAAVAAAADEDDPQEIPTETISDLLSALATEIEIPLHDVSSLTFGSKISSGAFGTVGHGTLEVDGVATDVAIKIVRASGDDEVKAFTDEVRASWAAGEPARESADEEGADEETTICKTLGISFDVKDKYTRMHLIMEKLEVEGDLHDVVHLDDHWEMNPERIRPKTYACHDSDGDYMLYTMERSMKISLGVQIARALRELGEAGVVHNDIKPGNILMLTKRGEAAGKKKKRKTARANEPARCRIRLIDFGLGGTEESLAGYACGTEGYMAPEVEEYGDCTSKSDVYSAGMCLLEIWLGRVFQDVDADEAALAKDRLEGLRRLNLSEPSVAALIRRCLAKEPENRPSPKAIQNELVKIRKSG